MNFKQIFFVLFLFQISCASKDLAIKSQQSGSDKAKMDVTMEVIQDYSDDYNVLIQLNFKNNDGRWIRVDEAQIDLSNSDNQPFNVIIGEDLVTWAQAKAEEKQIDIHNRNTKATLAGFGFGALAVAGVLSQDRTLVATGILSAAGSDAYKGISGHLDKRDSVQGTALVPANHLYSSFTIPSQTYIKKWVLVNVPTGRISKMVKLNLKTLEGENLQYTLNF